MGGRDCGFESLAKGADMYCENCGALVSDTARFCVHCGEMLDGVLDSAVAQEGEVAGEQGACTSEAEEPAPAPKPISQPMPAPAEAPALQPIMPSSAPKSEPGTMGGFFPKKSNQPAPGGSGDAGALLEDASYLLGYAFGKTKRAVQGLASDMRKSIEDAKASEEDDERKAADEYEIERVENPLESQGVSSAEEADLAPHGENVELVLSDEAIKKEEPAGFQSVPAGKHVSAPEVGFEEELASEEEPVSATEPAPGVAPESMPEPMPEPEPEQAIVLSASPILPENDPALPLSPLLDKRKMLLIAVPIAVILLVFALLAGLLLSGGEEDAAAPSSDAASVEAEPSKLEWPKSGLAKLLPSPKSDYGYISVNTESEFSFTVEEFSLKDYEDYVASCKKLGFSIEAEEGAADFGAASESGYALSLYYGESEKQMRGTIKVRTYSVELTVDCMENLMFSTYDIVVYVDGEKRGTIAHGSQGVYDLELAAGDHEVKVEKDGSASVRGIVTLPVSKDGACVIRANCYSGSVALEVIEGEGVVVEEAEASVTEEESAEVSSGDSADKDSSSQSSSSELEVLTVDNCPELAVILSMKEEIASEYEAFASKYKGRTISFAGRIDYIANHDNFTTRYDVLLSAGDYDPNSMVGPTFKFEDVSRYDMGITGDGGDGIYVGMNVYITAEVEEFDGNSGLFYLDPVSLVVR